MLVLEARRPSPSLAGLGLVKLSSKSNNQIQQLKSVIDEVVNILTIFFNVCQGENEYGFAMACLALGLT